MRRALRWRAWIVRRRWRSQWRPCSSRMRICRGAISILQGCHGQMNGTHEDAGVVPVALLAGLVALPLALVDAATGALVSVTPTAAQRAWLYPMALVRSVPEHEASIQVVVLLMNAASLHKQELSTAEQEPVLAFLRHKSAQAAIWLGVSGCACGMLRLGDTHWEESDAGRQTRRQRRGRRG